MRIIHIIILIAVAIGSFWAGQYWGYEKGLIDEHQAFAKLAMEKITPFEVSCVNGKVVINNEDYNCLDGTWVYKPASQITNKK